MESLVAPRCQFHVSVDMVQFEPARPAFHRIAVLGRKGTKTARMTDEEWEGAAKRTLWRCPVEKCPCVSQRIDQCN